MADASRGSEWSGPGRVAVGLVLALLVLPALLPAPAALAARLWSPAQPPPNFTPSPFARLTAPVAIDLQQLDVQGDSLLALLLPNGDSLRAERRSVVRRGVNRLTWKGVVSGDTLGSATFAQVGRAVAGTVRRSDGRLYRVRYARDGVHVVEDIDPARVYPGAEPRSLAAMGTGGTGGTGETCPGDEGDHIEVLVVYSDDARREMGGPDAVQAAVDLAEVETNDGYAASAIAQRIEVLCALEADYDDPGSTYSALDDLEDHDAGDPLRWVHALRDELGADAVVMITRDSGDDCGLSNVMVNVDPAFADSAWAVVPQDCLTGSSVFAHELGHMMSARHDWAVDPLRDAPYADDHGYIVPNPGGSSPRAWRTVMAEDPSVTVAGETVREGLPRLARWSDPDQTYEPTVSPPVDPVALGAPAGDEDPTDNVATLNRTATTVARFRCHTDDRTDAWMKDTWEDVGYEPEPDLAGEPMWKSPYIWVRPTADPDHLHAHEHENPVQGVVNYVYVKIHGGTAALTGELELYVAKASAGLGWKADWSRIGARSLAFTGDRETRFAEFPWTPTEEGHFCLLARWDSAADPMTTPEGTAIEPNVRGNNNLVWRNVNIVELDSGGASLVLFNVVNSGPKDATYELSILPARGEKDAPFLREGGVRLKLDPGLRRAWPARAPAPGERRSRTGEGFVRRADELQATGSRGLVLRGLRLRAGAGIPVRLELSQPRIGRVRPGTYVLDVVQTEILEGRRRVVGGVTYEVRVGGTGR